MIVKKILKNIDDNCSIYNKKKPDFTKILNCKNMNIMVSQ